MLTGKLTSTGDIDKKDFRLMAPRFQEEAFAKVRKPATLLLGPLCVLLAASPWDSPKALDNVSHVDGRDDLGWWVSVMLAHSASAPAATEG